VAVNSAIEAHEIGLYGLAKTGILFVGIPVFCVRLYLEILKKCQNKQRNINHNAEWLLMAFVI